MGIDETIDSNLLIKCIRKLNYIDLTMVCKCCTCSVALSVIRTMNTVNLTPIVVRWCNK